MPRDTGHIKNQIPKPAGPIVMNKVHTGGPQAPLHAHFSATPAVRLDEADNAGNGTNVVVLCSSGLPAMFCGELPVLRAPCVACSFSMPCRRPATGIASAGWTSSKRDTASGTRHRTYICPLPLGDVVAGSVVTGALPPDHTPCYSVQFDEFCSRRGWIPAAPLDSGHLLFLLLLGFPVHVGCAMYNTLHSKLR